MPNSSGAKFLRGHINFMIVYLHLGCWPKHMVLREIRCATRWAGWNRKVCWKTKAGSGTYVIYQRDNSPTQAVENANPLELIDSRFALEPHICRLCVLHGRREHFEQLDTLCERMERSASDPIAFSDADTEFHRVLASATRNNLLIWIIDQINAVRSMDEWKRMRHLTLEPKIIQQYNVQHRNILDAIRSREPEKAANVMKVHLETARLSLTRAADT